MSDKPKFWVVWNPRGKRQGYPLVRQESLERAQGEAHRLATKFPGRHFYVLEMVGYAIEGEPLLNKRERAALEAAAATQP